MKINDLAVQIHGERAKLPPNFLANLSNLFTPTGVEQRYVAAKHKNLLSMKFLAW